MERRDRGFLAAVLGSSRRENTADLPDERAFHPQSASLVEKCAHLSGHVAKARWGAKDDGVVIGQFVGCRYGCLLVELDTDSRRLIGRDGFSDTLERHIDARDGPCAIGNGVSHGF
ncbi:hypothetical protein D3C76_1187090 [compost metagenome]